MSPVRVCGCCASATSIATNTIQGTNKLVGGIRLRFTAQTITFTTTHSKAGAGPLHSSGEVLPRVAEAPCLLVVKLMSLCFLLWQRGQRRFTTPRHNHRHHSFVTRICLTVHADQILLLELDRNKNVRSSCEGKH